MAGFFQSLSKTIHASLALAVVLLLLLHFIGDGFVFDRYFFSWLFRYLHVLSGVMIGLLWYLNFVQIPSMPKIPMNKNLRLEKSSLQLCYFGFDGLHSSLLLQV